LAHAGVGLQKQYEVVFDLSTQPFAFEGWMIPLFVLPIVGLILVLTPQQIVDRFFTRGPKGTAGKIFAWVFFLFSGIVSMTWLFTSVTGENSLKSAVKSGNFSVAEGCLQHFHPMPEEGHDTERIEINGRVLEYSDYIITAGFHTTESHGGPIHPDSKIRLTVVGDDIVRVEVQQHSCPTAPEFPKILDGSGEVR
jgi:hypothetical protein